MINYLEDILGFIQELDQLKTDVGSLEVFKKDRYYKRVAERLLLIAGEIVTKISKMNLETYHQIRNADSIIGLRNLLAHAYDTVDHEMLWVIINRNIPELKEDINKLIDKYKNG